MTLEIAAQTAPTSEPDARRCSFMRDDGTRCNGWRVHGEELCAGHLGKGVAASPEAARAAQKQGARRRSEMLAKARKRPEDAYREALYANAEEIANRLAEIAMHGEPSEAIRAAEVLTSRVLGKPTDRHEVVAKVPETLQELEGMSRAELEAILAELELERGGSLQLELTETVDPPLTAYSEPSDTSQ